MTNSALAQSYLLKAQTRLSVLELLMAREAYSDVVREAQEAVELALKAMLRQVGIEPPKWHDVGEILVEHQDRFPASVADHVDRLATVSAWLRKEREPSMYGDIDFIPTERYSSGDGQRAFEDARFVIGMAERVIPVSKA